MEAANNRIKELQDMYDNLHYNAERERKLELKLKEAKETIKSQRRYTRGRTMQLHAATDGALTMEKFRKSKHRKKRTVASFLTDFERLGLKSNIGKKLVLNAGYKVACEDSNVSWAGNQKGSNHDMREGEENVDSNISNNTEEDKENSTIVLQSEDEEKEGESVSSNESNASVRIPRMEEI